MKNKYNISEVKYNQIMQDSLSRQRSSHWLYMPGGRFCRQCPQVLRAGMSFCPPDRTIDESGLRIRFGRSGRQSPGKSAGFPCHDKVVHIAMQKP